MIDLSRAQESLTLNDFIPEFLQALRYHFFLPRQQKTYHLAKYANLPNGRVFPGLVETRGFHYLSSRLSSERSSWHNVKSNVLCQSPNFR